MTQSILNFLNNYTPLMYWTQSLWRDEAFSVWIAQGGIGEIIRRTSGDFNPPLYYILLYYWRGTFGSSEIALRGFSLVAFLLFLFVVYFFARTIFKSKRHALITTILMALNPMLLYFAFELRMYSLLCLFATASMYFLYTNQWKKYVIAATLGMYTQPYMIFVLMSQMFYLLIKKDFSKIISLLIPIGILYLPWVPTLLTQLKSSGPMWMYPIDLTLVFTIFGNVFMGYEGTPANLWNSMKILSLLLLICDFFIWKQKIWRQKSLLFYCWAIIPVITVLSISVIKPIYVHRYIIYVAIAETFLLSFFIFIQKEKIRQILSFIFIVILLFANFQTVSFHRKIPIRSTFASFIPQLKSADVIYAQTPLVYYETLYYAPLNTRVYLYNPNRQIPPRYVGSVGMPENTWASTFAKSPARTFVITENGEFVIH